MGRLLKTKKIKGVEHYKLYSTISDGDINDKWLTKDELLNFIFWDRFRKFLEDFTSDSLCFPSGFHDKTGVMQRSTSEFVFPAEIRLLFFKDEQFFQERLREVMSSINVTMQVSDLQYKLNIQPKVIEEPKVIYNNFDYFDVIEFDGFVLDLKTTSEGGTFFTCFPISGLDYREKHPTKAGARIYSENNYTVFDIFDDYGDKETVKIHNSLEDVIKHATKKLTDEKLIIS